MKYRDSQAARHSLYQLAFSQGGYFTAKQAASVGYTKQHIDYHVSRANFERVERGLFRLPAIPIDEHDDLIRLSFWSRGRDDTPKGVVSHRSALALHELSQLLPGKVHLTVPPEFRKAPPTNCILHRGRLGPTDFSARAGFKVTTPLRTLTDAADDGSVPTEQLDRAIEDAVERGLVSRRLLREAARGISPTHRFSCAINRVLG